MYFFCYFLCTQTLKNNYEKKRATLLIILLINISFTACDKEKEDDTKTDVNKEELIEAHIWKGNEVKTYIDDVESGTLSISDYEFTFDANKDYTIKKMEVLSFQAHGNTLRVILIF